MSSGELKLIFNADDFGLSRNINQGILKAHTNGILKSTSIVAQGAAFDYAVEIAKKYPTLDVGIHLTLVEESPVLNPEKIPTLVNKDGKFFPHAKHFFNRYLLGTISGDDVHRELEAQFNKVLSSGINITHIDGHQHLHILKDVYNIIVKLAKKNNINVIRIPEEKIKFYMFFKKELISRILFLFVLNFIAKQRRKDKSLMQLNHFVGFFYGGNLNKNNLLKLLSKLPDSGICEVMCHPGLEDASSNYSYWKYNWSLELNALIDSEVINCIQKKGIILTSFKEQIEKDLLKS